MIEDSEIEYYLQRNFINYSDSSIEMIKQALSVNGLRIKDIEWQIDSANNVQDVLDIIYSN